MTITLGPFLSRWSGEVVETPEVEWMGQMLEFASPDKGARLPIYRRTTAGPMRLSLIPDYLFYGRTPFRVAYKRSEAVETPAGLFVSLEHLLTALYQENVVARPLTSFLAELREYLPLNRGKLYRQGKPTRAFRPEIEELGYYVVEVYPYGRGATVCMGWVCPQDRKEVESAPYFPAGCWSLRYERTGSSTRGDG